MNKGWYGAGDMITLENIHKTYPTGIGRRKKVLEQLSFSLATGHITGLVGPSGCGKSTLGRLILRLEKPDKGRIRLHEHDIWRLNAKQLHHFRRHVQMVPQHPDAAFNPRLKIETSLREVFRFHDICAPAEQEEYLLTALSRVAAHPDHLKRFPAQLSGGEIQRLAIARAIITKPEFLVLDEITSMLDVSVQATVIRTLQKLQGEQGTAYLFITHDMRLARMFCHSVMILDNGKVNEFVS